MDWIGNKLTKLIEEGKKALNREIVVMSDTKEDEVDDGSAAWVEEQDPTTSLLAARPSSSPSISRSSSTKRVKKPSNLPPPLALPPSISLPPSTLASRSHPHRHPHTSPPHVGFFNLPNTTYSTPSLPLPISPQRTHSRGTSTESGHGLGFSPLSFREDERSWESPELRELMEKARTSVVRNRGT
jgi:hypothetical protein